MLLNPLGWCPRPSGGFVARETGDPGTELMQVRALLEEGRNEEAIPLLVQLLEREPDNLEASHVLAMLLSGHRLIS